MSTVRYNIIKLSYDKWSCLVLHSEIRLSCQRNLSLTKTGLYQVRDNTVCMTTSLWYSSVSGTWTWIVEFLLFLRNYHIVGLFTSLCTLVVCDPGTFARQFCAMYKDSTLKGPRIRRVEKSNVSNQMSDPDVDWHSLTFLETKELLLSSLGKEEEQNLISPCLSTPDLIYPYPKQRLELKRKVTFWMKGNVTRNSPTVLVPVLLRVRRPDHYSQIRNHPRYFVINF